MSKKHSFNEDDLSPDTQAILMAVEGVRAMLETVAGEIARVANSLEDMHSLQLLKDTPPDLSTPKRPR